MMIIFYLIVYGLTNIICNEYIMIKIREYVNKKSKFFGKLVSCPTCASFWISMFLFLIINPLIITNIYLLDMFFIGLSGSGLINLLELIKIKFK